MNLGAYPESASSLSSVRMSHHKTNPQDTKTQMRTHDPAKWTGMMPVDDMALAVTDTGGSGTPVV